MTEFPRLLYIFHMFHVYLTLEDEKDFFFIPFIHMGRRLRMAYHILQQRRNNGGINLNMKYYNLASSHQIILDWINNTSEYAILMIEQHFIPFYTWTNLLYMPYNRLSVDVGSNPLLFSIWKTWKTSRQLLQVSPTYIS